MNRTTLFLLLTSSLVAGGCYIYAGNEMVLDDAPGWTGADSFTENAFVPGDLLGLAGQDIYRFRGTSLYKVYNDPFLGEFGGPYTLTSVAQTRAFPSFQGLYVHGKPVGGDGGLTLLYADSIAFNTVTEIEPYLTSFEHEGVEYDVAEICEIAAVPPSSDDDARVYASMRACSEYGCVGGVMEFEFTDDMWSPKPAGSSHHVWILRASNSLYSNYCMPISVTRGGDQTVDYLALADTAVDEISLFDARNIAAGPLDRYRSTDLSFVWNFRMVDISVEGRRDGSTNYAFVTTLWRPEVGGGSRRLQHWVAANGSFGSDPEFLTETVPADVSKIGTRGLGFEGTSGVLYTFGDKVMRRSYHQ